MKPPDEEEAKLPELGPGGADRTAAVARVMISSLAAGFPGLGPLIGQALSEVVSELIPNQRIDRVEKYLLMLGEEIALLKIPNVDDAIKRPENIDLIEDGAFQAVRALTDERKRLIAKVVAKGIANEDQTKLDHKRIMNLLAQLDDEQITVLAAHGSGFVAARMQKIRPEIPSGVSPQPVAERYWFFERCESELMRLGLLERRITRPGSEGFIHVTWLGKAILRAIDLPHFQEERK
jgi:hypothetical protein